MIRKHIKHHPANIHLYALEFQVEPLNRLGNSKEKAFAEG